LNEKINTLFAPLIAFLEQIVFWDPFKALGIEIGAPMPIIVLWLITGAIYFTIQMRFVNVRCFKLAIDLVRGKYDKPEDRGEVTHFQALATALSATVGLGNIAGVAVAISTSGPGATFWMIVAGLLGMTSKFTECTLGLKYRKINNKGEVSGGPMYYIPVAFQRIKLPKTGKFFAAIFSILCVGGALAGGNMLQSNQTFAQLEIQFPVLQGYNLWVGFVLAILTGSVIIGGLHSIARVAEKIVPFMAILYVSCSLFIIFSNFDKMLEVAQLIFSEAFTGTAVKGGFLGVMIIGFKRASFSNEAGIGSASIAHSAAKTNDPVSEGIVSLLEPFIDTVVICTMTALVIVFTGQYNAGNIEGTALTSRAFGTIISWFPLLLTLAVFLFAFATMISWSYYGLKAWTWLFGESTFSTLSYKILYLTCTVLGCALSLKAVTDLGDMMILAMAFPNIIALLIMSGEVKIDLKKYLIKIKKSPVKA
jgi:alanine or glycine:cation symporter, AGCS family